MIGDFIAFCREGCPVWFRDIIFNQSYFASFVHATDGSSSHRCTSAILVECSSKRLFVTEWGICGLGLRPTREGDVVAVLFGCSVPVILRTSESSGEYRFVGQSYVRGCMHGQMIKERQNRSLGAEVQSITLI
jgi:hypothetical protein